MQVPCDPDPRMLFVYSAVCSKCYAEFEMDLQHSLSPDHPGTICPECRSRNKSVLCGVLNWKLCRQERPNPEGTCEALEIS